MALIIRDIQNTNSQLNLLDVECHLCWGSQFLLLWSVILLNVIMPSVVLPLVIIPNVLMPTVDMLCVAATSVDFPYAILPSVIMLNVVTIFRIMTLSITKKRSIIAFSIIALDIVMLSEIYAECRLCWAPFVQSVANKPITLSVVMPSVVVVNVVAPDCRGSGQTVLCRLVLATRTSSCWQTTRHRSTDSINPHGIVKIHSITFTSFLQVCKKALLCYFSRHTKILINI